MSLVATSPLRSAVALGSVLVLGVVIGALIWSIVDPTSSDGDPSVSPTSPTKICPERFAVDLDGASRSVPLCTTTDLEVGDPIATRLVVVIHGDVRNARTYFDDVTRAADASDAAAVVVVAPQFPTRGDVRRATITDDVLEWSAEDWKSGELSRGSDKDMRVSSFEVIDQLILAIVDGGRFPSIGSIVVAGHSAGGQFVNRYAAGTSIEERLQIAGVAMTFVVANPSSYLYFDGRRVDDAGAVEEPGRSERADCPGYDRYKYGLDERNAYMANSSRREIRQRYGTRVVTYVAGALDTDPDDPSLDRSCEGRAQGPTRLARARAYQTYLRATFPDEAMDHHRLVVVPGIGHDGGAILNHPLVRQSLFGSGEER